MGTIVVTHALDHPRFPLFSAFAFLIACWMQKTEGKGRGDLVVSTVM